MYSEEKISMIINSFPDMKFDPNGKDLDNCAICYDVISKG